MLRSQKLDHKAYRDVEVKLSSQFLNFQESENWLSSTSNTFSTLESQKIYPPPEAPCALDATLWILLVYFGALRAERKAKQHSKASIYVKYVYDFMVIH